MPMATLSFSLMHNNHTNQSHTIMKTLDPKLTRKVFDHLNMNFEEVYVEKDSKGRHVEFYLKRTGKEQFHDMLSVYLDCDDDLTVSADCWNQPNNRLLEKSANFWISTVSQ